MKILSNKTYREYCSALGTANDELASNKETIKNLLELKAKKEVEADNLSKELKLLKEDKSDLASKVVGLSNRIAEKDKAISVLQNDIESLGKDAKHWKDKYNELLRQSQRNGTITRAEEAKIKEVKAARKEGKKDEPTLPFRPKPVPQKLWIMQVEAACILGMHEKSVRKWAKSWGVRIMKVNNRVWYSTADIYRALESYQRNKKKKKYVGKEQE